MKTPFSFFLQTQPNAGLMQLILLGLLCIVIYFFIRSNKKKKSFSEETHTENIDNNVTNSQIRAAGYDLIHAGSKLITALIILIITVFGNIFFWQKYYEELKNNPSNISEISQKFESIFSINFILAIVIIGMLYVGFSAIRDAGKKLFKE